MTRHLERLLWRHRCGIVSGDAVAEAFERRLQQLLDERLACPMDLAPVPGTRGAWLSALCDLESSIDLARAWTREARFDRAVCAARRAVLALERVQQGLATTKMVYEVRACWLELVARYDLLIFQDCSTKRSIDCTLENASQLLGQGATRKARFVATFAHRQIEAISQLSRDARLRRELHGRITRLRTRGLEARSAANLERIAKDAHLGLAASLLDDLEMDKPLTSEGTEEAPAPSPESNRVLSRFERTAEAAGLLLVELERCTARLSTEPTTP